MNIQRKLEGYRIKELRMRKGYWNGIWYKLSQWTSLMLRELDDEELKYWTGIG